MYRIIIKKTAKKELEKLPKQVLPEIVSAIDGLAINPQPVNSKKLRASSESTYRIRIGTYRLSML